MNSNQKFITGAVLCIIGIIIGLYIGLWVCFIGGIVDVIQQIRAEHIDAMAVACGVAKVFFAGVAGWISALCFLLPGSALIKSA